MDGVEDLAGLAAELPFAGSYLPSSMIYCSSL
jgi:hypothetical protein